MKLDDLIEILKALNEFNDVEVNFDKLTFPDLKVVLTPYENYSTIQDIIKTDSYNSIINTTMNDCGPVSSNMNSAVGYGVDTIITDSKSNLYNTLSMPSEKEFNKVTRKQKHQCHNHIWKEK